MTYTYECSKCKQVWEEDQSIKAAPLKDCPHCKEEDCVKRLINCENAFILSGGGCGWAKNGYSI